ncbi:MAG: hypothetical protein LLF96_10010 [Eubacteriales bacterium]|nr:hypothetical protein [Eubacteriales bacterium]
MQLKMSYRFLRGLVRVCTYHMRTEWEQPFTGEPSVFVCNHAGAMGPVDICSKFPLADELHPWMNAQVLSARLVPAYVRQDYWWDPQSRWAPVLAHTLPYIAAAVLPPILRTTPTVPVYHDIRVIRTLRESLRILKEGEHLVIFPEQPSGHGTHEQELNRGFLQIAPVYVRATGKPLAFWPVCIDTIARVFRIGKPQYFDTLMTLETQADALIEALARGIGARSSSVEVSN